MTSKDPPRLGKYELLARLAAGGMAELFLARQSAIGGFSRMVVIKRILPHLGDQFRFIEMFLEEARLASKVHHTNVVQILDVDQDQGSFFIAMEYIDGVSLGAVCRKSRLLGAPIPLSVACEIISQACDGLQAAHELTDDDEQPLGLVHRDVSPQNLMLSRTGVVKLVDFGIAKAKDSTLRTRPGAVKGKTHYMSPEQVRAEELDERTDIFSLGAIFFELLAARRLFDGDSEMATWRAITEDPIPELRKLSPETPEEIAGVVERAVARDRDDRFSSAADMGSALRAAMEGLQKWTSPRIVADYIHDNCAEMLDARSLSSLGQLETLSSSLPRLEGFDEGEETLAEGRTALTRPGKFSSLRRPPELQAVSRGDSVPLPRDTQAPRPPRRGLSRLLLALLGLVLLVTIGSGGYFAWRSMTGPQGPPLYFAHPPTYSQEITAKGLQPLVEYLEARLNRPIEVVVTDDYTTLREEMRQGKVQLANLSPLLFVQSREDDPPPKMLVAHTYEGSKNYQSYIVTRDDAGIDSLSDLRGRSFCYVDLASTSGYLLPRQFLRSKGFDPERYFGSTRFSGRHEKVLEDVVAGRCDAGAVYSNAFSSAATLGVAASRLRLVSVAGDTPLDVICASASLPEEEADRVRRALLDFNPERDLGREIVSPIFRIDGFITPRMGDFENLERAARAEGLIGEDR